MDLALKGKKAIVTGATRGIGRAIAEALAAEGADVAICARDRGELDEAVTALSRRGVKAWGSPVDVADSKALRAWVGEAAGALGGIDIFIANVSALAVAADEAAWRRSFDVAHSSRASIAAGFKAMQRERTSQFRRPDTSGSPALRGKTKNGARFLARTSGVRR